MTKCGMALEDQSSAIDDSIIRKYADIVYKCKLCHDTLYVHSDRTVFVQHIENVHKHTGQWQCTSCSLKFLSEEDLNHHMQHCQLEKCQRQPAITQKTGDRIPLKQIAYKLMQEVSKVSSDSPKVNTDDVAMEISEANLMSRKRGLTDDVDDDASSIGEGLVAKGVSPKENTTYNSIVLSMKAECAMLNSPSQEDGLSCQSSLLQGRDELQTVYGRYASMIRIKGNPFLYCQVCMYKTNADDDFRLHFLSDEHWQTVAKMEQPPDQKFCRDSNKPSLTDCADSLPDVCSLVRKKQRLSVSTNKPVIHDSAESDGSMSESACKPVLLSSLTQLEHIFSGFTAAEAGDCAAAQNFTPNSKTTSSLKENIRRHLKEVLEEHPEGRLSYSCLLDEIESYIDETSDIIELGINCDTIIKEIFPSAQAIHVGANEDMFYSGVQLKYKAMETKKTPRDIGLTSQIFDILPDLLSYTGNLADSVPRSVILTMLSRQFNQPAIVYWGPQCNKAIEALYPNIEIRRRGRSKVTYYYGLCLKTEQTADDHRSEA